MKGISHVCRIQAHTNSKTEGEKMAFTSTRHTVTHKHSIRSLSTSHCHLQCYGHKDNTLQSFMHLCRIILTQSASPTLFKRGKNISGPQKVPCSVAPPPTSGNKRCAKVEDGLSI